ncbi:hypothetical protein KM043_016300 [Ampulex compressa]|nr:hypothetical protein KM043_016300 [Ampulex compressa]
MTIRESGVQEIRIKAHSCPMAITLEISSSSIGLADSDHRENDKMKFLIALLALVAFAAAQQPPVAILKQAQDISPDGSYQFSFETENGIAHSESGAAVPIGEQNENVVVATGNFQYTAPDGTPIAVSYTADENGFHPEGAHLPQPHPVPALIQRSIDYILAHPPKPE